MLGLSLACVVGVPFATAVGQSLSWRAAYLIVAALAALTALLVWLFVPDTAVQDGASPLRELGGLLRPQVWLTLGIGAIGFGGMFAVYSYVAPTLTQVTRVGESVVPVYLAIIGTGMVFGFLFGGWLADRSVIRAIAISLVGTAAIMAFFVAAAPHVFAMGVAALLIGCCVAIGPALQTRLMDVAGEAQTLAAALNHSAFNAPTLWVHGWVE